MGLQETAVEQLRRLAHQIKRLREDADRWQRAGRPETAKELRDVLNVISSTVERIERELPGNGRRGVPTIFDP